MDFEGKKLLTIDDEDSLRRSIRFFFEDIGFDVFEAADGISGIEMCREFSPDIVLVDLRMPGMNGIEVIKRLAKEMSDLPIIVVSGTGVIDDALSAMRAGADDYVTKPVRDMKILEHVIERTLEKAELKLQNRAYQEHLEELVEQKTRELRHAQKMDALGTLAGGIAHDFNNILTSISGYTELALMECHDEKMEKFLRNIESASGRAATLVKQILMFCRQEKHEKEPVNLSIVLKEALSFLRSSIPPDISIEQDISSDLYVLADPANMHQVIMNICTNAYQAMADGGGVLSISLRDIIIDSAMALANTSLAPGRYLRVDIKDTGCGMDRETQQRIFDPYFTTKEKGKGTGLGLSVAHGIICACGGVIAVSSEPGRGSRFSIYLQALDESQLNETSHLTHPASDTGANNMTYAKNEATVLFVDDEDQIVDMVSRGLASSGYRVEAFTDPQKVIELFSKAPDRFDIAVMDMAMPGMDGRELADRLLKLREDLPVILCTGFYDRMAKTGQEESPIREYISKPFQIRDLAETIKRNLDG